MGKAKNRLTPTTALKTGSGFRLMPEARGFFYPNAENPYPNAIAQCSHCARKPQKKMNAPINAEEDVNAPPPGPY